ncbi:MAG: hypothetical protein A4E26_00214 [Methanobacterium sp. PtaU1.Bin097]|jgi:hypothetical protein|nr:MAG: hypothetical protein A4E26_00214 [Methanobacterium sp. PtaU1.Bin097]
MSMKISKYLGWRVRLGLLLVVLAGILYLINFTVFHDLHDLEFYLSIDTAFLPIEILFVVLVIESAISAREKSILLEKLNMVIGTFFSELGTDLMRKITKFDIDTEQIRQSLIITDDWTEKDFKSAASTIKEFDYSLEIGDDQQSIEFLQDLKEFLKERRDFLLRLLENPNLLEHETFTDLLRAVFHVTEELEKREDLTKLPPTDYMHLNGDVERVYGFLISEWIMYMEHLMNNYPYLFSLAMRVNPFDPHAKVEID